MKNKAPLYLFLVFLVLFFLLEIFVLWKKPPQISEGWFSDIAYHLNKEFNGKMASDIPWGTLWSQGIGKLFFLIHHLFYKLFGVGIFQARMVSFLSGYFFLLLVFRWSSRFFSPDVALLSAALLSVSPSWWTFLADGRQDILHCLFAFASFYLLSFGIRFKRYMYFFIAGFVAALSVDIDYRGIEIIMCAFLFSLLFFEKGTFIKRSFVFLTGSFVAFIVWFSLNVAPMGFSNFLHYNIASALLEGGPYTSRSLLSELFRFAKYSNLAGHLAKIEIVYWMVLFAFFYKYHERRSKSVALVMRWLLACVIVMSFVERSTYPSHFLMYSPFICILCGVGLNELFARKRKLGWGIFVFVLLFGLMSQTARAGKYFYHAYIKKDYAPELFFRKLRASVDLKKNIIGDVTNWYAFTDAQYYGGPPYLYRVQTILKEFQPASAYKNDDERSTALLGVLKIRKIEYVIASRYFKEYLSEYFPQRTLPRKNFELVAILEDYFLGSDSGTTHPMRTEVYKVVSYEP